MLCAIFFVMNLLSQIIEPSTQSQYRQRDPPASAQCGKLNNTQLYNKERLTQLDEYTWLGRISYTDSKGVASYRCLAVLFNVRHALGPAHCVIWSEPGGAYSAKFGNWNADKDATEEYLVSHIVVHPEYRLPQFRDSDNDIAVLQLTKEVRFSPICLLPPSEMPGAYIAQRLEVVGYSDMQKMQLKAQGQTTGQHHCSQKYAGLHVTEHQICAYINAGENLITGAALMGINVESNKQRNFFLIGILTHGSTRKIDEMPDLFIRIWPYREWILENSS